MTQTLPDTSVLERLDFQAGCGIAIYTLDGELVDTCSQEARWIAVLPCCGHAVLFCHHHATDTRVFKCRACKTSHTHKLGWKWSWV